MPRASILPEKLEYWEVGNDENGHHGEWLCRVCDHGLGTWKKGKNVKRHEESAKHQKAVGSFNVLRRDEQPVLQRIEEPRLQLPMIVTERDSNASSRRGPPAVIGPPNTLPPQDSFTITGSGVNFGLDDDYVGTPEYSGLNYFNDTDSFTCVLDTSHMIKGSKEGELTIALNEWFATGPTIGDDLSSDSENEENDRNGPQPLKDNYVYIPDLSSLQNLPSKELGLLNKDGDWFPWGAKSECVIDVLRHLPRSVFSEREMTSITWAMNVLGASRIPSESRVKVIMKSLQIACGVDTIRYQGSLGHIFYVNNILQLISQELSNPKVRPHLVFFPEDAPEQFSDACHGQHWLEAMDAELMSPMVREKGQEFYTFEPTMLVSNMFCIPHRWYRRSGSMRGRAWRIISDQHINAWVVIENEQLDIAVTELATSFPYLIGTFHVRGFPDPRNILGYVTDSQQQIRPWYYTDPQKGNKWRALANGAQVFAFPIWLYCDDTSGNSSKKWNKHNSFLFTPAGLSHKHMHFEYNVHFLSTSNIAPPLEMSEAIVSLIKEGQENGVWAYDCELDEMVLLIPSVLAVLGDNPMQSELSSHVGLNGNLFCRVCFCRKGGEESDSDSDSESSNDESSGVDEINPEPTTAAAERHGNRKKTAKKKAKKKKRSQMTIDELVHQATLFLTVSDGRTKEQTAKFLSSIYRRASTIGSQTRAKKYKTSKGIKCAYQEHFLHKINDFIKNLQRENTLGEKQRKLDRYLETFPENKINPLWQLKGLDMHQNTPVEILHVVLLGFVKYFWRDAMKRLSADQKALITIRISSFDTEGLGLSALSGKTLVQYSGSLTGRDFRAISQIAPFILYDVLDSHIYESWLALSAVIPLLWQPVIEGIDDHLDKISMAIEYLLSCTARWTPQWFNKPKFHILLHLVEHIKRFGPALLFATETFESYNALIRSLSIHSNRQAPSRDIALGFANANRIRHFTSGGKFQLNLESLEAHEKKQKRDRKGKGRQQQNPANVTENIEENNPGNTRSQGQAGRQRIPLKSDFYSLGSKAWDFMKEDNLIKRTFSGPNVDDRQHSAGVQRDGKPVCRWESTFSSKCLPPEIVISSNLNQSSSKYAGCKSCFLQSGDSCKISSFVIAKVVAAGGLVIGQVVEILQIPGSDSELFQHPDLFLLSLYSADEISTVYSMPKLFSKGQHVLVKYDNIMCTVNVQHNCVEHNCSVKDLRVVRQEREKTSKLGAAISHVQEDSIILNCAQMRNSRYLKAFRPFTPYIDRAAAINEGAAREIAERSKRKKNTTNLEAGNNSGED